MRQQQQQQRQEQQRYMANPPPPPPTEHTPELHDGESEGEDVSIITVLLCRSAFLV